MARTEPARAQAAMLSCRVLRGVVLASDLDIVSMAENAQTALALHPSALNHALMGIVEVICYGERQAGLNYDPEETMQHFRRALQISPENGLVNALCGHAHSFFRKNVNRGLALTSTGVKLSPGIGICWLMHAVSLTYAGRLKEASAAAKRSQLLNGQTLAGPFSDFVFSFTKLMLGDLDESILHGEASRELLPWFRPTLLNLGAAYAITGQAERGRTCFGTLRARDPDFSMELLLSPKYPFVNSTHREIVTKGARLLGLN